MLKNYLKIAYRNLFANGFNSLINLVGLVSGIACSIIIFFYVAHETQYDTFHEEYEKIFKVTGTFTYGEREFNVFAVSSGYGPTLAEADERVTDYSRSHLSEPIQLATNDKSFLESSLMFADKTFLDMFDFPVISGNPGDLGKPSQIFFTESAAIKYFGRTEILGEEILLAGRYNLVAAGVVKDPPSYSTFKFDVLVSSATMGIMDEWKDAWTDEAFRLGSMTTFLKLSDPSKSSLVETTIKELNEDPNTSYKLAPLKDLHLNYSSNTELSTSNLLIFSAIGAMILLLAIINYINLTIAKSTSRFKEIGVRKVNGAGRKSIALQFFIESSLFLISAFILAFFLAYLLKPLVTTFLDINLDNSFYFNPFLIGIVISLLVFVILLAGIYPALSMSKSGSVDILKGKVIGLGKRKNWLQKSFTSIQFGVSVGLIFCTIVVSQQLLLLKDQELGLDKEQVMVLSLPGSNDVSISYFKNEIKSIGSVMDVAVSSLSMFQGGYSIYFTNVPGTEESVSVNFMEIDENFIEVMGLAWGTEPGNPLKPGDLIVNESALDKLNIRDNPIGADIGLGSGKSAVRGVVADFKYAPLLDEIDAMAMKIIPDTARLSENGANNMYVKLAKGSSVTQVIDQVNSKIEDLNISSGLEFYFLDDAFNELFNQQARLSYLFKVFSFIAVLIASLGLLGLISFTLERRVKEIGIRKVLGANPGQLVRLFTSEYVWIFIIGSLVALPVAWIAMEQWLTQFNQKIELSPFFGIVSFVLLLTLGFLVVGLRSWRASNANVVDSLRSE